MKQNGKEKPIRHFLIGMGTILVSTAVAYLLCGLAFGKDKLFDWTQFTFIVFLYMLVMAAYFIGRLIAYKTNMFKKAKDRDNVLICVFAVLAIVFIMLAIALI